jgi:hypothetical protein
MKARKLAMVAQSSQRQNNEAIFYPKLFAGLKACTPTIITPQIREKMTQLGNKD